ncbi:GLUT4 regulating protein TUG-domain-containing protein [Phyllosticta citricarpa]|uniref:GLUT4 regulating protein TUG-domain-containing protein n=1 Tax=Phyllosticta citricarpa TaxID=55181 RepID=A0ABR1LPH3_9PEZI
MSAQSVSFLCNAVPFRHHCDQTREKHPPHSGPFLLYPRRRPQHSRDPSPPLARLLELASARPDPLLHHRRQLALCRARRMASHVVVVDSSARRATIRTTPAKALSDVLQEACTKFGIRADNYTLKYNNKTVDLSRTIRLANLPQGAKLDLVQGSRSPAVVNVALQLEQPGQRLTHKFPSNTSLWQVLRVFETIAPAEQKVNLTQRGRAVQNVGSSSAGRLHYEIPSINIMGRELSTFLDLQKTLGQVGLNSGSALLRLQFKDSGEPLEKAMMEITEYFKSLESEESTEKQTGDSQTGSAGDAASAPAPAPPTLEQDKAVEEPQTSDPSSTMDIDTPAINTPSAPAATAPPPTAESTSSNNVATSSSTATDTPNTEQEPSKPQITDPSTRPMTIFFPPSSSTPTAALSATFDESDYIPTIEHAKSHQAALANATRNQRLASDAELAARAEAAAAHRAAVAGVTVRVRLPDGHQLESRFGRDETGKDLYSWVRGLLASSADEGARFVVRYNSPENARLVTLPDDAAVTLVRDLGLEGRVLMTMSWDDGASVAVRRGPVLADKWARRATELKVKDPGAEAAAANAAAAGGNTLGAAGAADADAEKKSKKGPKSAEEKESKLRGILGKGLFGKKK